MSKVVEGVLTIVDGLKPKERKELIHGLVDSGVLSEDDMDALVVASRRDGATKPLEHFIGKMKKQGRLT